MDNLFITEKVLGEFTKEANVKLSKNPDDWMQEVVKFLHQSYPWLADAKIQVNFNRVDADNGMGVGQIQLDDKVSVPLVVDNFRLSPLDVFWVNGKLHPLTKSSLQEIVQGTKLGKPVAPGEGAASDMALFSRTQPPYDGRYVYAAKLDIPFGELERGASLAFGSQEALEYAMKKSASFREVFADNVRASKEVVKTAAVVGPKGVNLLKRQALPVKLRKPQIKKAGVYKVAMANEDATCIVADHVFGLDGKVRDGVMGVFELSGDRYYYASDPIFGEPVELDKVATFGDRPNGWGAFVLQKNGSIIATEPVKVVGRSTMPGGIDKIAVDSIHGTREIHVSPSIKNIHTDDQGDIFISPEWSFVPCSKMEKLGTYDPVDMSKEAADLSPGARKNIERLRRAKTVDQAEAIVNEMKRSGDFGSDPKIWSKVRAGVEQSRAAEQKLRKKASAHLRPYPNLMKEATFIQPISGKWLPMSSIDGRSIVKVALDVGEDEAKTTVDAMLGLNFITEENAYKFVDQIEKIGVAKEACAKLLLASRLGLPVSQEPLKTAMYALDNAERDLRQYSHTIMENEG